MVYYKSYYYRFLDSDLLNVDLYPTYVTINIKGRIFQLVFPQEINVDYSVVQRSITTGHLVIRLPKASRIFPSNVSISSSKPATDKITQLERKQGLVSLLNIVIFIYKALA